MSNVKLPPKLTGRNRKYPWHKWEDGRPHKAEQGQHFKLKPEAFRSTLTRRAWLTGRKVATRVRGKVVFFQFLNGR